MSSNSGSPAASNATPMTKTPTSTQPIRPRSSLTPPRASSNNNYASEHTPIASAKRPIAKRRTPSNNANSSASSTPISRHGTPISPQLSPMHTVKPVPRDSHADNANANADTLPYHRQTLTTVSEQSPIILQLNNDTNNDTNIDSEVLKGEPSLQAIEGNSTSWMGRKVDALFSPVLTFLHHSATVSDGHHGPTTSNGHAKSNTIGHKEDSHLSQVMSPSLTTDEQNQMHHLEQLQQIDISPSNESTASFDHIPGMTNTDSLTLDADGDVPMLDSQWSSGSHHQHHLNQQRQFYTKYDPEDDDYYFKIKNTNDSHDLQDCPTPKSDAISDDNTEQEEEEEEFNPYLFIKSLPPYHYAIPFGWNTRPATLPPLNPIADPPICLVLDLDETLVHCTVEPIANADMVFPVEFNGIEYTVHVRCRPYLQDFLKKVSEDFEVVVFTASQQVYADKLLDKIDPDGKYIRHRLFRDSCLPVEGNFLKDLNILGRDLRQAVLVDNSPHAFGYQVDNGIPIESWFDDPNDTELLKLEKFLRTLHGKQDVREIVRAKFQTYKLVLDA